MARINCIACLQRVRTRYRDRRTGYRCRVCRAPLRDSDSWNQADKRLHDAVREWLAAAHTHTLTEAGELAPMGPPFDTSTISVLTLDHAVEDLALAVNERHLNRSCPNRLRKHPGSNPSYEYEHLSFTQVSPALPSRYWDVLYRWTSRCPNPFNRLPPEVSVEIGSIFQGPDGHIVVRWLSPVKRTPQGR